MNRKLKSPEFLRRYACGVQFDSGTTNDGWTIRDKQFKIIHLIDGQEFFYDLDADPFETGDLM